MTLALPILVSATSPTSAEAQDMSLRYYEDIVGRYHGRPASRQEILEAQAGYPRDDLVPPTGLLLLARQGPAVLGCAGMRVRQGEIGEVTRVFVDRLRGGRAWDVCSWKSWRAGPANWDSIPCGWTHEPTSSRREACAHRWASSRWKRTIQSRTRTTGSEKNFCEVRFVKAGEGLRRRLAGWVIDWAHA